MQRRQSDIDRESVKDVASRLRQFEDHNLAIRLQEEEFNHHYNRNRTERKVMGVDTRKSKEEQELEKKYALEKRLAECREIAARDAEVAKQLQMEIEAEERRLKQEQAVLDQEIARRMQARYEPPPVIPQPSLEEDERIAREMSERYLRQMRGLASSGSLDERTRNELAHQHQATSPPSSLQPRRFTLPDDLGPPSIPVTHFPLSPTMPPSTINLPPLPSYTEVCTPTTPSFTTTVSSACAALLNDLPAADIVQQLEVLCADSVKNLDELSNAHQNGRAILFNEALPDAWRKAKSDPLIWLDRITSVFKTLKPWNSQRAFQIEHARHNGTPAMLETVPELQVPWLELGGNLWEAISHTVEAYQDSSRIVEHACRCSRYLIRSMGVQSVRFVNSLASLIVKVYDAHPHSCFLYLASVIVDEYAVFDSVLPYLLEMGGVIARRSFQLFAKPNGLRDNPDTVDDLFRLAIRFVQKSPAAFFSIEFSSELFQCGIHALEVDHSEAHRSVTKFFLDTTEAVRMAKQAGAQYPALDAVELLFTQRGEELVWHCLSGALFFVSHPLRKDLGEILFELNRVYPERFSNWLRNGITRLQNEHRLGATPAQLETYHARTISATRQSDAVTALRDLCKFYS